jgi:hypothetical protein
MLQIKVILPSGCSEDISLPLSSKVGDLRILAQKALRQRFLKLATAKGEVLADSLQALQEVGLQDGDQVTAIALEAKISASSGAFTFWYCGGDHLVTWGDGECTADVSGRSLKSVQRIKASLGGFAAIQADGSVATWGHHLSGGDSSPVQGQ